MSKRNRKKGKGHKKTVKKNQQERPVLRLRAIPEIIGGEFHPEANEMAKIQAEIDALTSKQPKEKKRVLYITEASYLKTGFSTYLREVMKRLHSTGKYELAEFGSYGHHPEQDPRAKQIPWKYYHCMPENAIEETEYKRDYRENQFGKWKLSYVLADFKPDIILLNRDNWMDTHVLKNEFRGNCKVLWMPTVDGFPQKWQWLSDYSQLDGLYTYSWFGKRVLEEQSRSLLAKMHNIPPLNVNDVMQPGVNTNVFRPLPREQVLQAFRINDPEVRFVGTVMRNQPRKLFPRIIEAFRMFKEQHPQASHKVFLLLHTSIPDVGWDIPEIVAQNGLNDSVVYSYHCLNCRNIGVMQFVGSPAPECPVCKKPQCWTTPNTQHGMPEPQFALIYNLMSLYIQGSIAEGDGMPPNEAKACGIPCLMSDYSALYEKARNGGALPIRNDSFYLESETHQNRSLFNRQHLVDLLADLLSNETKRQRMAGEARKCAEQFYSWDLCAKKWEREIDKMPIKSRQETWDSPIEIRTLPNESPEDELSDEEFITWCYHKIVSGKDPDAGGMRTWKQTLSNAGPPGSSANKAARDKLERWFREKVERENAHKEIRNNPKRALTDPVERVKAELDPNDKFRILYVMPETAGDILISTGVIDGLRQKFKKHNPVVYVATKPQFANILEGNPQVKKVLEFHDCMFNYRTFEKWGPQGDNPFDIVYTPSIVTQKIPHWIHNGYGEWLGQTYADQCHVDFGHMWMREDPLPEETEKLLPEKFVTVQGQTRQDPKDYDHLTEVLRRIKNIAIVQVGGPKDKKINLKEIIDLRGKTTPQQLAHVLRRSSLHVGGDSFPMHVAGHVGTNSVIVFGGTYKQQGMAPCYQPHVHCIETEDRGPCGTSCHLIDCAARKQGYDKCINNIPVERVLHEVSQVLGEENVEPPEPIKISAYAIIKDGIKYGFPYEECIRSAMAIVDEMVVVDGGSTDGTYEHLLTLAADYVEQDENKNVTANLKIFKHEWDTNCPTLFGDEKTYARQMCTGTHLIQLDCDELIHEPNRGDIRKLVEKMRFADVIDLPCINFYGDDTTIRVEPNAWKWRISRNDPNIVHGVHKDARKFDPETGMVTMDKNQSDSCEYIYNDSLAICNHRTAFDPRMLMVHEKMLKRQCPAEAYAEAIKGLIEDGPVVFHYSWLNHDRKKANGEFWDRTYHGERKATHNRTEDIDIRLQQKDKEILVKVDFAHPLRSTPTLDEALANLGKPNEEKA